MNVGPDPRVRFANPARSIVPMVTFQVGVELF
jgi:hypothetical protein